MELGQKVEAAAYLVRKTLTDGGHGWGGARKVWQRAVLPAPATGVLVGLRTISEGHRVNLGDEGVAYKATAYQRAALVAFGLRSTPRLVALDDIKTPNVGGEARLAAHQPPHTTTATPQGVASTDQLGGRNRSERT